ncbi:hypothetical protein CASFOL_020041 [Castilleja foliolosa]|uniref:Uncharacterized protein n=1 Tax=Castilleja foliolosa TaxID=1961234 RepID=A0ABD3D2G5_9LAMI
MRGGGGIMLLKKVVAAKIIYHIFLLLVTISLHPYNPLLYPSSVIQSLSIPIKSHHIMNPPELTTMERLKRLFIRPPPEPLSTTERLKKLFTAPSNHTPVQKLIFYFHLVCIFYLVVIKALLLLEIPGMWNFCGLPAQGYLLCYSVVMYKYRVDPLGDGHFIPVELPNPIEGAFMWMQLESTANMVKGSWKH